MSDVVFYLVNRLSVAQKLETELARIKAKREVLEKTLLDLVPPSMKRYFKDEENIAAIVLEYGMCSTKIWSQRHGFRSMVKLRSALDDLKKAWKNQIVVIVGEDEGGGYSVRFFPAYG